MKVWFTLFILFLSFFSFSQTLPLPPRNPLALNGTQIISKLIPLSLTAREDTIFSEIKKGNVPDFLRNLVPVYDTVIISGTTYYVNYFATPDYFALGCDSDYFLCPMTPLLAQKIADYMGFSLPTRKMSDKIWKNATVKMAPQTIPPSSQMTTVPVFANHDSMVWSQRQTFLPQHTLGELVAGDKKDVIISNHIYGNPAPGRVVIYGWHYQNGTPIQPLYYGHEETYADYSHGIRFVQNELLVNGCMKTVQEILTSSTLNSLLSDEGAITVPRYPVTANEISTPNAWGIFSNGINQIVLRVKYDSTIWGYNVALSNDGKCFSMPQQRQGNNILFSVSTSDSIYYFKIAAISNNGGVSSYSEVLSANIGNSSPEYIIVNGFDRNTGTNTYDYVIQHGKALHHIGRAFHSITNEAWQIQLVNINDFDAVDFILGEESSVNETFSTTEQQLFTQLQVPYFVSGSEIGWDLDHLGSTSDQNFYHQYLYANYVEDAPNNQASTYYNGIINIPSVVNLPFTYDNGTHGTYNVRYPDVVSAISPAADLGYYTAFPAKSLGTYIMHKMVYMAVPFECVYPASSRDSLMHWIDYILLGNTSADVADINQNIVVYPNPASDMVWIKNTVNETIENVEILSVDGKLIKSLPVNNSISKIDINDLNTGIYLLKINQKDNSKVIRLSVFR
ncbi:MAG TPA: T9SS type A sorting domain-containing protein [Bacteroidales bacterium]|nr:T9SS type A sorting domain-containing protein [Bacteroidales bacterium]